MNYKRILTCLLMLALAGCVGQGQQAPYPGVKVGKPYEVFGHWYEPSYSEHYDEIGVASWYGPGFHGGNRANSELYDQNAMTAAHRTLPLPSIVRVTNLDNGMSALVKINDRGPFAHDRIIDLSKAAALKLGVYRTGTAKVRVQFLDKETREYVQNMQNSTQFAMGELKAVNPEEAGKREEARTDQPQLKIESRMFGSPTPGGAATPAEEDEAEGLPPPGVKAPPVPGADESVFDVIDDKPAMPPRPQPSQMTALASAHGNHEAAAGNGFMVQAGTFSQQRNADALTAKIEGTGTAQVMEVMVNGRKFYRVMVGPYAGREDARNMLSKLASIGISDAKIVHN